MTRRNYLKSILVLGAVSMTSFGVYKWFEINQSISLVELSKRKTLIAELAELIIPETDTPGAKSALVEDFIITVLVNCTPLKQQHRFLHGLLDLEDYTRNNFEKEFLNCSLKEKNLVLTYFADHSYYSNRIVNKIDNKLFGEPFYMKLRELTVEGYATSRLGATKGFNYDYIPGRYQGCLPMHKNQKSWATK